MTDEKRLLKAIRSKNYATIHETFNYIYDKYKPLVIFIASRYLKGVDDIKDIVQETFIEFFTNIENVHSSIKGYLSVVARNKALNFIKKRNKWVFLEPQELDFIVSNNGEITEGSLSNDTFNELVMDMKRHLSIDEINIIFLHLLENNTFEDIALNLKMNVNTVKTKYYRALKKYKEKKVK